MRRGDDNVAAIRCLVNECKANVEAGNKIGETPLHTARACDNVAAIRCLVNECKANVEAGDNDGETPLRWAAGDDKRGRDPVSRERV
jgi:ankyrin repeat protein